jgi:hypothetical protein
LPLVQIVEGVSDAQEQVNASGAEVNPHLTGNVPDGFAFASGRWATIVHFDVGVTATEGTGTKGGIGVVVGAFAIGSSGQSKKENSAVNRVSFAVPVRLPKAD